LCVRVLTPKLCAAIAVASAAVALGACGSDDSSNKTTTGAAVKTPGKDAKVAAEVPAAAKSKGTLTVAADAAYPPNEFLAPDGKTVIGMDADLAKALGAVMGLKVRVVNVTFDAIIPGLAAKKYDVGMSSFTDTREREKTVDFVTYASVGTAFFVKSSGGPAINTLADLCGHKVAVEKGTTQQTDATAQGKKCKSAGKGAVKVLVFPDQNGANLALSSGRADVGMADLPVVVYEVKQTKGQFKQSGKTYGPFPYGIAIPRKSGLVPAFRDALKVLIAKGTYKAIFARWGLQASVITSPKVNAAIS
jgi:polar amino acid transport system substrate-binding protein